MPAHFTFYNENREAMLLSAVDDTVREILELETDPNKYSDEYATLTWAVLAYKNFEEMERAAGTKNDILRKLANGFIERKITYSTGRF